MIDLGDFGVYKGRNDSIYLVHKCCFRGDLMIAPSGACFKSHIDFKYYCNICRDKVHISKEILAKAKLLGAEWL